VKAILIQAKGVAECSEEGVRDCNYCRGALGDVALDGALPGIVQGALVRIADGPQIAVVEHVGYAVAPCEGVGQEE